MELKEEIELLKSRIDSFKQNEYFDTKYECKICMNESIRSIFLPCGHALACCNCAEKVEKCPVCNCPIEFVSQIYVMDS